MLSIDHYDIWCKDNNCSHGHCPEGCEHPQPIAVIFKGETVVRLVCGRCLCKYEVLNEMVPCSPKDC